ncbi:hypothetical protein M5689_007137 [Euphorbia peplus]|nr:hypothetical protein M5689_007137 [Euphorbia peplus]
MERLAHLISDAIAEKKLKLVKIGRHCPPLSHLFFADDVLLFIEGSAEQLNVVMEILGVFCAASGQKLNVQKSRMYCSKNMASALCNQLNKACGIPLTSSLGDYLGVPLCSGRVTKATFTNVVEAVQSRLSAWKVNSLSLAGRMTLIQSVTGTVPNHIMQSNLLPSSILNEIDKLKRRFLWGGKEGSRKLHLVAWDEVCKPKSIGGTRIRKSLDNNKSMLM